VDLWKERLTAEGKLYTPIFSFIENSIWRKDIPLNDDTYNRQFGIIINGKEWFPPKSDKPELVKTKLIKPVKIKPQVKFKHKMPKYNTKLIKSVKVKPQVKFKNI
jgi:hypothetical protein